MKWWQGMTQRMYKLPAGEVCFAPFPEELKTQTGRVDVRRALRKNIFCKVSEDFPSEPRKARRRIAKRIAKKAWLQMREQKAAAATA